MVDLVARGSRSRENPGSPQEEGALEEHAFMHRVPAGTFWRSSDPLAFAPVLFSDCVENLAGFLAGGTLNDGGPLLCCVASIDFQ